MMEDSKKPSRIIKASPQSEMFSDLPPPGRKKAPFTKGFLRPDPELLFVGHQKTKDFLVQAGLVLPLQIREMVNEVDFTVFESKYEMNGRAPYHPSIIMGLVIYGIIKNQGSLRQLEILARADLERQEPAGGSIESSDDDDDLPPSTPYANEASNTVKIGRNKRKTLKPHKLKRAIETGETVVENRRVSGTNPKNIQVCTTDPEAMILSTKQGVYRPAYVASFATNHSRMIIGYDLHQSSEIKSVAPILEQAKRVAGPPENIMMDTGYHSVVVAQAAQKYGARLICPPKPSTLEKTSTDGLFSKHLDFEYLPDEDAYRCPAGETLNFQHVRNDKRRGTSGRVYRAKPSTCQSCPLQSQCTSNYRKITRSQDEHLLDNMRKTHALPECQVLYAKRLGSVEPVIGAIKSNQGLTRFTRFGKRRVTLELCLHVIAHNVKRAAALVRFWLIQKVLEAIVEVWRQSISFFRGFPQNGSHLAF